MSFQSVQYAHCDLLECLICLRTTVVAFLRNRFCSVDFCLQSGVSSGYRSAPSVDNIRRKGYAQWGLHTPLLSQGNTCIHKNWTKPYVLRPNASSNASVRLRCAPLTSIKRPRSPITLLEALVLEKPKYPPTQVHPKTPHSTFDISSSGHDYKVCQTPWTPRATNGGSITAA